MPYQPDVVVPDSAGVAASRNAIASFRSVRADNNWFRTEICNQHFYTVLLPADSGKLLLLETSEGGVSLPEEYVNFVYEVRAWPLNDPNGSPIWTIQSNGVGSEIVQAGYRSWFYKTWSPGFSGDWGHITYFDLATGKKLASAQASILAIVRSGSDQWRLITLDFPSSGGLFQGVLRYLRSDGTADSLFLDGVSRDVSTYGASLRFIDEDRPSERELVEMSWHKLGNDISRTSGFGVQICAGSDTLRVPVKGDRFDLEGIESNGGLRIRGKN